MGNELETIKVEIEELKQRISALEERVAALESREQKNNGPVQELPKEPSFDPNRFIEKLVSELEPKIKDYIPGLTKKIKKQMPRLSCEIEGETRNLCRFEFNGSEVIFHYVGLRIKPDAKGSYFIDTLTHLNKNSTAEELFTGLWPTIQRLKKSFVQPQEIMKIPPYSRVESSIGCPPGLTKVKAYLPALNRLGNIDYPKREFDVYEGPKGKIYYANLGEIDRFLNIWGIPALELPLPKGKKPIGKLAEESILMRCGYSVSKENGLSVAQRHQILNTLLLTGKELQKTAPQIS